MTIALVILGFFIYSGAVLDFVGYKPTWQEIVVAFFILPVAFVVDGLRFWIQLLREWLPVDFDFTYLPRLRKEYQGKRFAFFKYRKKFGRAFAYQIVVTSKKNVEKGVAIVVGFGYANRRKRKPVEVETVDLRGNLHESI